MPIKLILYMLAVSMLPVSKIILFDFRIVLTMSYFVFSFHYIYLLLFLTTFCDLFVLIKAFVIIVLFVFMLYSAPSVYRPPLYRQNSCLSRFSPSKIPRYTAKLSYCHPPQVFRHKSRKTNLNSPISTAHNYLLTAVY